MEINLTWRKIMSVEIAVALITLSGIIVSLLLNTLLSMYRDKIKFITANYEFAGQLYSKRLELYLEIFELISGFIKMIIEREISYEELCDFYKKYSILDSKSGLLFSYTAKLSFNLINEMREIVIFKKPVGIVSKDTKDNLIIMLGTIERSMKIELNVYHYKDIASIKQKFKLPPTYEEAIDILNAKNGV
jgi:hypothetical protein